MLAEAELTPDWMFQDGLACVRQTGLQLFCRIYPTMKGRGLSTRGEDEVSICPGLLRPAARWASMEVILGAGKGREKGDL